MTLSVQERVAAWVMKCFGAENLADRRERAMRLLEEAMEVAQAECIMLPDATRLAVRVWSRAPGKPQQEIGGVGVTLLAYAESVGVTASTMVENELRRVSTPEVIERCRAKQREKAAAGVARELSGQNR